MDVKHVCARVAPQQQNVAAAVVVGISARGVLLLLACDERSPRNTRQATHAAAERQGADCIGRSPGVMKQDVAVGCGSSEAGVGAVKLAGAHHAGADGRAEFELE